MKDNSGKQQKDTSIHVKNRGIIFLAVLDDVVLIALIFLLFRAFNLKLAIWGYVLIGFLALIFIVIAHHAVVSSFHRRKVSGREGMIGLTAVVTKQLEPRGTVLVGGEYWNAGSPRDIIDEGEEVIITGIRGLVLEVKRKP